MQNKKDLYDKGRKLTTLLRHKPGNLKLDEYGYAEIEDILQTLDLSREGLDHIVETNNKKRFIYNDDETKIRATQGHSFPVKKIISPVPADKVPHKLYHGTTKGLAKLIRKSGIKKMGRQDVHLSKDFQTATQVGNRGVTRQDPLEILVVNAKLMAFDGIKIYETENHVWLTDYVDPKYIN